MSNVFIIKCPHCSDYVEIHERDINCQIFRHGAYKHNFSPINPHMPKTECDRLYETKQIYGCAKPFRFNGVNVEQCEYI